MHMDILVRTATAAELTQMVALLAEDVLGKTRERYENPLPDSYKRAFQAIDADPNNELLIACQGEEVVGVLQITFTPFLTHQGGWRASIEGVRAKASMRGKGVGSILIKAAVERAKARGCHLVQLTMDKQRADTALPFYRTFGFQATHEGLKLKL
ncbi:GNAT family N-acetyltransferase [Ornithinibacillus gellani]|nr:GNAT family N-acetyltransferase [Ornithinibacillus gellani]TQS71236.1 GNAT family N-acetyltransferase [Ornithinibacillus gellani]